MTKTELYAEAGCVIMQHDRLVGQMRFTPAQARVFAAALIEKALEAEALPEAARC